MNLLLAATFLVSTTVVADPTGIPFSKSPIPRQGPPAEEVVRLMTANLSFPVVVDEMSQLDSINGYDDTLTYNYSITKLPTNAGARLTLSRNLRRGIEQMACGTQNFVTLLEGGYTVVLNYSFRDPKLDVHIRLLPRKCGVNKHQNG